MNITQLMMQEAKLINTMFRRNDVRAKVSPRQTINVTVGYISYGLQLAMNERFAKVEGLQRELSNLLTNHRQRSGIAGGIQVIPVSTPRLALEVPHPQPEPLLWSPRKTTTTAAHTMLIGRSFLNGPQDERIAFDDAPHTLIAGITGAGKSVLLQTMLLSLCAGTSPAELRLVLVDLKNEDLVPFERLPHVHTFAGTRSEAAKAIEAVVKEKDKRITQRGYKPYRLVLVIDEMAQIAGISEVKDMLGDLASIGRSKAINLIGATQHPTDKGGLGSMLKANFPIRLVGMVAPGQSHIATGRPATHADLLPGKGAFLRCEGPNVYRFQSFYIEPGDVIGMANYIAKDIWKRPVMEPVMDGRTTGYESVMEPVIGGYITGYEPVMELVHTSETDIHSITGYKSKNVQFPITDGRPLTEHESVIVREMAARGDFDTNGKFSMNRAVAAIYGSKNPDRIGWVRAALDGPAADDSKIIRLRKAG